MEIEINRNSTTPIYKQIIGNIKAKIVDNSLKSGELLPSMNQLCETLGVSKETVKKAYNILRGEGLISSAHGKGFFVNKLEKKNEKILIMFDILSTYKKDLFDSFARGMAHDTEYTIRLFNQDIDLFERFLEENLGLFDYYVITPHLPLDSKTQARMVKAIKKLPNRQLVLLDRKVEQLPGNYIAVYQDFENDVYSGFEQAYSTLQSYKKLNVCTLPGSLYGPLVKNGIKKFCKDYNLTHEFYNQMIPPNIVAGEAYLILSGQLEHKLIQIVHMAKQQNLKIGKDIGLFSYNESPINEIILNGLSVLSTDFTEMGNTAATLIREKKYKQVKCSFKFIQRNTL